MSDLTVLNPVAKPAGYKFKLTDRLSDLKNSSFAPPNRGLQQNITSLNTSIK